MPGSEGSSRPKCDLRWQVLGLPGTLPSPAGGDMRRRKFFKLASGIVAWLLVAHGQTAAAPHVGVPRVAGSASQPSHQDLLRGLRDLGYIEGQNVVIEFRSAEGRLELLP